MNTLNNDTIFIISTSLNLGGSEIQAVRLANYLSKTGKKCPIYIIEARRNPKKKI